MMPPPLDWPVEPARRLYTPLQPPAPLPWYVRDPIGALVAAMAITLGMLVFIKICELLGRL